MSTCFYCKGKQEHKLVNHIVDLGDTIIIIKDVPAEVCTQCGETSYSNDVAKCLEEIVKMMRHQNLEIVVSHYDKVAYIALI